MNNAPNRRQFLAATTAAALGLAARQSWAEGPATPLQDIFAKTPLTDQHGEGFDIGEMFKKGPVLVMFGWSGCKLCLGEDKKPGIVDSIAGMQQEFLRRGVNIPIVFISTTPKDDNTPAQRKGLVTSYYKKGVRQFADEALPKTSADCAKAYANSADKKADTRIMHFVYPPSEQHAEDLQTAMGLTQDTSKAQQHSAFLVLFKDGVQQKFPDPTNKRKMLPGRRSLPLGETTRDAYMEHGADLAVFFSKQLGRGID